MAVNTRVIVADYVKFRLEKDGLADQVEISATSPGKVQQTMRVMGEEFEGRYNKVFEEMSSQLHITPNTAHTTFVAIVDELFRDCEAPTDQSSSGTTRQIKVKWGRVVALFAFAGCLSVQCVQKEMPSQVDNVIEWTTTYIDNHLSSWIQQNHGWDGFVTFYENGNARNESPWPSWSKVAGIALSAVGVVTLGSFLANKS